MGSFNRKKRHLRFKLLYFILKFKKYSINNAIILTSESRSGSTWLMELLGSLPRCVVQWEPLHVDNGLVPKSYRLGNRPFIKEKDTSKKFQELFRNILTLKIYNQWTTNFIKIKKLITSKYVVTKFVRANSLLPWLTCHFQFKHKPILLFRHPITTCISQLKNFSNQSNQSLSKPYNEKVIFIPPDCINNDRYNQYQEFINTLQTPLERQVALWCVNNKDVIGHEHKHKWITVYYEDMVLKPEQELSTLLTKLELPFTNEDFQNIDFKKPSRSDYLKGHNRNAVIQLESFLTDLEPQYLKRIQQILDYFDVTNYEAFSAYPVKSKLNE